MQHLHSWFTSVLDSRNDLLPKSNAKSPTTIYWATCEVQVWSPCQLDPSKNGTFHSVCETCRKPVNARGTLNINILQILSDKRAWQVDCVTSSLNQQDKHCNWYICIDPLKELKFQLLIFPSFLNVFRSLKSYAPSLSCIAACIQYFYSKTLGEEECVTVFSRDTTLPRNVHWTRWKIQWTVLNHLQWIRDHMQRQAVRNRFIGSLETVYANRHVCSMQIHVYSSKLRLPAGNQDVTCRCRNMFQYMVTDGID